MAPELLDERPAKLNVATDMYAFGITAWVCQTGMQQTFSNVMLANTLGIEAICNTEYSRHHLSSRIAK
jgi:hypothetical protein